MEIDKSQFTGCFLGLAMGDALGAGFEGGFAERLLWRCIGKTVQGRYRYTDDTQMSIDLAESFIAQGCIDQTHLAKMFARSYRWSRGYGSGAAQLLKKIRSGADWNTVNTARYPMGSFGNGAAMRAPILALCFPHDLEGLINNSVLSAEITHAHPLAIEGAKLIALATRAALLKQSAEQVFESALKTCEIPDYHVKIRYCRDAILNRKRLDDKVLKKQLGNQISALNSSVSALYFALHYLNGSQNELLRHIFQLGGDTDTIAAMANAIWGAFNGLERLDLQKAKRIEQYERVLALAEALYLIAMESEVHGDRAG